MSESEEQLVGALHMSRYFAAAIVLALLWTAESLAPMFARHRKRLGHGAANLGLAIINSVVAFGFAFGMLYVTERSRAESFGLLHRFDMATWTRWPAAIVLIDAWQYWWHRINHRVPLLWRFHAVHHADAEMDATSAVRFHSVEIVFSFTARLAVLPLLGVTIPQMALYETISLPIILFHHSNIRLPNRVDRLMRWLIVTPWMHWVHHSRWRPETDSNYASLLSVWDRLFGSFRLREKPGEIALGLDDWPENDWRHLPGMLLSPFRNRAS